MRVGYFANIGANMSKNVPQKSNSFKIFTYSCIQSFALPEICEKEVNSCIDNIKSSSAQGPDEIPPKFVKLYRSAYDISYTNELLCVYKMLLFYVEYNSCSTPKFLLHEPLQLCSVNYAVP